MNHGMKRSLALLAMLPVLLAVRVVDAGDADFKSGVFDPPSAAPDFELQGSNGSPVVLSKFRGQVVALAFGFSYCQRVCPVTLANLSEVFKKLGAAATDVQVIFVSVDPDRDTLPVLGAYARGFAKQIDGLSGPPNGLAALTRRYRVLYRVTKDSPGHPYEVMHSNSVFFFDRSGRARLVTTSTDDVAGITDDVKRLLD